MNKIIAVLCCSVLLMADTEKLELMLNQNRPVQITTAEVNESMPYFDTAGQRLFFCSDQSGNYDLYVKDLIGDKISRLTVDPNRQYAPQILDGRLFYLTDATSVQGELLSQPVFSESPRKYSAPYGRKGSYFLARDEVYCAVDSLGDGEFLLYRLTGKGALPRKIENTRGTAFGVASDGRKIYRAGLPDSLGFNNLYQGILRNDSLVDEEQITFGAMRIENLSVSPDGKAVVYDRIDQDTDGDGKIGKGDYPFLYLYAGENVQLGQTMISAGDWQLTTGAAACYQPAFAGDKIYFTSEEKGNPDIWQLPTGGIIPCLSSELEQLQLAEQIYNRYFFAKTNQTLAQKETQNLLLTALMAFKRVELFFPAGLDSVRIAARQQSAEILVELGQYKSAESVYRLLSSRYVKDQTLTGMTEISLKLLEIQRKNLRLDVDGYELDQYISYFKQLLKTYQQNSTVSAQLYLQLGIIHFQLKKYDSARQYLGQVKQSETRSYPEALFYLAKISMTSNEHKAAAAYLLNAIKISSGSQSEEKYIQEYLSQALAGSADSSRIRNDLAIDETLPLTLRASALLQLASQLLTDDEETALTEFDRLKKWFVKNPEIGYLKFLAAEGDRKLAAYYLGINENEQAAGILEFSVKNYKGVYYNYHYSLALRQLSDLYYQKARAFADKQKHEQAFVSYLEAFNYNQSNLPAIRGLIDSYFSSDRENEAETFFIQKAAAEPANPAYLYALGYIYSLQAIRPGNYNETMISLSNSYLNRTIETDSHLLYAYLTLSYNLEALHRKRILDQEKADRQSFIVKTVRYFGEPFKQFANWLTGKEENINDYADQSVALLQKGLALADAENDREVYLKMVLNLANSYYNFGEYGRNNALKYYKILLDRNYEFSSEAQKAQILERMGHCYFTLNDEQSVKYYDEAAAVYKKLNDRESEIRTALRSALFYLIKTDSEGDLIGGDDAATLYKNIIIKLESEGRFEQVKLLRRNIGYAYQIDIEPEASQSEIAKVISDPDKTATKVSADSEYITFSFFGLPIPIWKFSLQVGSSNPEGFTADEETALLYSIQSVNYAARKDFAAADSLLIKKYELFAAQKKPLALSLIANRLGVLGYYRQDYAASSAYFKQARDYCRELKLYRMSLYNQNNLLKALLKSSVEAKIWQQEAVLLKDEQFKGDVYELAVYHNLLAVYAQKKSAGKAQGKGSISAGFNAFYTDLRQNLYSEKELFTADTLLNKINNPGTAEKKLQAAVKFNLAKIQAKNGDPVAAGKLLNSGLELVLESGDLLQSWRFKLALGLLELDIEKRFNLLSEAEKELAAYLPEIETYELISGWQEDILPLYDQLIGLLLAKRDYRTALVYQERYKSRLLVNSYASRYFDLNLELHNIHIKKITDNNREIQLRSAELEKLKQKNRAKDAARRQKLADDIERYRSELTEIISGIQKSEDSRLLQFVAVEAPDPAVWQQQLDNETAAISYYSRGDSLHILFIDQEKISHRSVKLFINNEDIAGLRNLTNSAPGELQKLRRRFYDQLFAPVADLAEEMSYIYIVPEWNWQLFVPFNLLSKDGKSFLAEDFSFSKLLSLKTLDLAKENININNRSVNQVKLSSSDANSRKKELEIPAILHFDSRLNKAGNNALDNSLTAGSEKILVRDLLQYKLAGYLAVINGLSEDAGNEDCVMLINSLIYGGIPTILLPLNFTADHDSLIRDFVDFAGSRLPKEKLDQLIVDYLRQQKLSEDQASRLMSLESFGLFTLSGQKQQEFARENLKSYVAKGSRFFTQKRYWQALYFYNSALQMAERSQDQSAQKNLLKLLSECYTGLNDYTQAVETGKKLAVIYRLTKDSLELAGTYNKISRDYLRGSQTDSSEVYQLKYLYLIQGKNSKQELSAYELLSLIAARGAFYTRSNSYRLTYLAKAGLARIEDGDLTVETENVNEQNAPVLFSSLRSLLANYYSAQEVDSAIEIYQIMEDNRQLFKTEPPKSWGKVYEAVGLCYFKKSFYKTAWEYYLKARKLFTDKEDLASINQNLADLFYKSNELQKAGIAINQTARYVNPDDVLRMMRLYNTESLIQEKRGNYEMARSRSYEAVEKALAAKNRFEESTARVNLAKILLAGEPEKARTSLLLAKQIAIETKNKPALIAANFYLAEYHLKSGSLDSAGILYQTSLDLAAAGNDKIFEARSLLKQGKLYALQKMYDKALSSLKQAGALAESYNFKDIYYSAVRELAEQQSVTLPDESRRLWQLLIDRFTEDVYFTSDNSLETEIADIAGESFTALLENNLRTQKHEEAFRLIQLKRQLFIRDEMNNRELLFADQEVNNFANLHLKTKTKIKKLRSEYLSALLNQQKRAVDSLENAVSKIRQDYILSFKELKSHRRLFYTDTRTASEIRKDLPSDQAILLYLLGKTDLNILVLTKDSLFSVTAGKVAEIRALTNKFYKNLYTGLNMDNQSILLYDQLIKPVEKIVQEKRKLLFYADDYLTNLPFEVLNNGKTALIETNDIGEFVPELLPGNKNQTVNALSLVNAFTPAMDELKFADKEAENLQWNWSSTKTYSGKTVTEKLVSAAEIKNYTLLHFATHAVINPKDSADSYIQLAADDRDDGKYTYTEILESRLNGQSVILSGCDTGGKSGEEYAGFTDLSQAFLLTGAQDVIASRWRADDLASAVLMKRYFRYLKAGQDKVTAISNAKRIVKNHLKAHPYYWAQFKIMGN